MSRTPWEITKVFSAFVPSRTLHKHHKILKNSLIFGKKLKKHRLSTRFPRKSSAKTPVFRRFSLGSATKDGLFPSRTRDLWESKGFPPGFPGFSRTSRPKTRLFPCKRPFCTANPWYFPRKSLRKSKLECFSRISTGLRFGKAQRAGGSAHFFGFLA